MQMDLNKLETYQANKKQIEVSELEARLLLDIMQNSLNILNSNPNIDPKYQDPTEFVRIGLMSMMNKFKSEFNINSGPTPPGG